MISSKIGNASVMLAPSAAFKSLSNCLLIFFLLLSGTFSIPAQAQQLIDRQVLNQSDLKTNPDMQVIMAKLELKPGAVVPRHSHNGDEYLYILSGGKAETAENKVIEFKTGGSIHFPRGVPHAGFKVIGSDTLVALTIHIVDKDKPLRVLEK